MITKYQVMDQTKSTRADGGRVEKPFLTREEALQLIEKRLKNAADIMGAPPVFYIIEIYTVEEI